MRLYGIVEKVGLNQISKEWLKLLLVGEVVNIGETISFVYDRYQISRLEEKK